MHVTHLLPNAVMTRLLLIWFSWWIWFDLDFLLVSCVLICFYMRTKWHIFYLMCWYFNIVLHARCYIYNPVCKRCNEYYFLRIWCFSGKCKWKHTRNKVRNKIYVKYRWINVAILWTNVHLRGKQYYLDALSTDWENIPYNITKYITFL